MSTRKLMERRKEIADDGEPILTKEPTLTSINDQPYVTPTLDGVDIVGLVVGDDVALEIYRDHVEIWPLADDS